MIIGTHIMIQSKDEKADRAFLRDVLKFPSVDAGGGFMIFGAPSTDIAVHESDKNNAYQLYLMCDDVEAFIADMRKRNIACASPANQGWGTMTHVSLPGGGKLHVYQPHHKRPKHPAPKVAKKKKAPARRSAKKAKKKAGRKAKRR